MMNQYIGALVTFLVWTAIVGGILAGVYATRTVSFPSVSAITPPVEPPTPLLSKPAPKSCLPQAVPCTQQLDCASCVEKPGGATMACVAVGSTASQMSADGKLLLPVTVKIPAAAAAASPGALAPECAGHGELSRGREVFGVLSAAAAAAADACAAQGAAVVATVAQLQDAFAQGADSCMTGLVLVDDTHDTLTRARPVQTPGDCGPGLRGVEVGAAAGEPTGAWCMGVKPPEGTPNVQPFNKQEWQAPALECFCAPGYTGEQCDVATLVFEKPGNFCLPAYANACDPFTSDTLLTNNGVGGATWSCGCKAPAIYTQKVEGGSCDMALACGASIPQMNSNGTPHEFLTFDRLDDAGTPLFVASPVHANRVTSCETQEACIAPTLALPPGTGIITLDPAYTQYIVSPEADPTCKPVVYTNRCTTANDAEKYMYQVIRGTNLGAGDMEKTRVWPPFTVPVPPSLQTCPTGWTGSGTANDPCRDGGSGTNKPPPIVIFDTALQAAQIRNWDGVHAANLEDVRNMAVDKSDKREVFCILPKNGQPWQKLPDERRMTLSFIGENVVPGGKLANYADVRRALAQGAQWDTFGFINGNVDTVYQMKQCGANYSGPIPCQSTFDDALSTSPGVLIFGVKPAQSFDLINFTCLPWNAKTWSSDKYLTWGDAGDTHAWPGINVAPLLQDPECIEGSTWLTTTTTGVDASQNCAGAKCEGVRGLRKAAYVGSRDGPLQDERGNPSFALGRAFGAQCSCDGWQANEDGTRIPYMPAYSINPLNDSLWWQCVPDPCWTPDVPGAHYDQTNNACVCHDTDTFQVGRMMTKRVTIMPDGSVLYNPTWPNGYSNFSFFFYVADADATQNAAAGLTPYYGSERAITRVKPSTGAPHQFTFFASAEFQPGLIRIDLHVDEATGVSLATSAANPTVSFYAERFAA